jgi:hypothetical protein
MKVRAVLGVVEYFARFGQNGARELGCQIDRSVFGEKIGLAPLFPRFERFAVDLDRETDAEPLFEMEARNEDARAACEVRAVLPQRAVRRLIVLSNT